MLPAKSHAIATGAAAIALSVTPPTGQTIYISCLRLHLSAVGGAAENLTVTVNSASGATYDTVILSQVMTAVQDLMWLPDRPIPIINGDVVDIAYANSNTRTYGIEVLYSVGG